MKQIPLTGKYGRGKFALVDDEDWEKVKDYKWILGKGGHVFRTQSINIHNVILPLKKGFLTDHKDGNTLDNRKSNLRYATNSQNQANSKKESTYGGKPTSSIYKGVYRYKNYKWVARINVNRKPIHLGCFDIEIEAAQAYNRAAEHYFGEFARLNEGV